MDKVSGLSGLTGRQALTWDWRSEQNSENNDKQCRKM